MSTWKERNWEILRAKEQQVQWNRNVWMHNINRRGLKNSNGSGPESESVNNTDLCRGMSKDHPMYTTCLQQKADDIRREEVNERNREVVGKMHEDPSWQWNTRMKRANNHLRKPEL